VTTVPWRGVLATIAIGWVKVTAPLESTSPDGRAPWSPRIAVTLAIATVGLGLNLRAWTLLGPRLAQRSEVGLADYVLLMALPLLVAALVRLPVGVLTDRYGA